MSRVRSGVYGLQALDRDVGVDVRGRELGVPQDLLEIDHHVPVPEDDELRARLEPQAGADLLGNGPPGPFEDKVVVAVSVMVGPRGSVLPERCRGAIASISSAWSAVR